MAESVDVNWFIQARERKLLTQEDLASKAGVSRSLITTIETKGHANLQKKKLRALADVLEVDPDELKQRMGESPSLLIEGDAEAFTAFDQIGVDHEEGVRRLLRWFARQDRETQTRVLSRPPEDFDVAEHGVRPPQ